jgi:hypothetical protein
MSLVRRFHFAQLPCARDGVDRVPYQIVGFVPANVTKFIWDFNSCKTLIVCGVWCGYICSITGWIETATTVQPIPLRGCLKFISQGNRVI